MAPLLVIFVGVALVFAAWIRLRKPDARMLGLPRPREAQRGGRLARMVTGRTQRAFWAVGILVFAILASAAACETCKQECRGDPQCTSDCQFYRDQQEPRRPY